MQFVLGSRSEQGGARRAPTKRVYIKRHTKNKQHSPFSIYNMFSLLLIISKEMISCSHPKKFLCLSACKNQAQKINDCEGKHYKTDYGINVCECLTSGCRCDHCHDWSPLDPLGVIQISISGLGVIFCLGGSCSATSMSEIELNGPENLR